MATLKDIVETLNILYKGRSKTAWTDYPISKLGDDLKSESPIRRCTVVAYDGNKYAIVRISDHLYSIKSGYIYSEYGRCGVAKVISDDVLKSVEVSIAEFLCFDAEEI